MSRPRVVVVGLGPAGPELVTAATDAAIAGIDLRFVRTLRHPAATAVPDALSFDHHYERADTIEEVYAAIVEDLVAAATREGTVLYAVPGSPAVAERTVELLRADPRVDVTVHPALSSVDLAWARLGVDPLDRGARIVDGHRFAVEAAGERGPLLVLQCDAPDVLSAIKLAVDDGGPVTVLQRLGLPDERIDVVPWHELDRVAADHLTSLWMPDMAAPVAWELARFDELVRLLRTACPWDAAQTHTSLRPYVIEEAYEVAEAIDQDDLVHLEEELGDLLLQVVLHATLGAEAGEFTLADVARGIHDKLVRRHPHVFGDGVGGAGDAVGGDGVGNAGNAVGRVARDWVAGDWERLKREERLRQGETGRASAMDGIPQALPGLLYAEKIQRRAAAVGFDWPDAAGAWPKIDEELAELRAAQGPGIEEELGDLLFACVNVARHLGADAEGAVRQAAAKFAARFAAVERLAAARGIAMPGAPLIDLDALWDEVKAGEHGR